MLDFSVLSVFPYIQYSSIKSSNSNSHPQPFIFYISNYKLISAGKLNLKDVYQYVYQNHGTASRGFQLTSDHTWRRTSASLNYGRFHGH